MCCALSLLLLIGCAPRSKPELNGGEPLGDAAAAPANVGGTVDAVGPPATNPRAAALARLEVQFRIIEVQTPRAQRDALNAVWSYAREAVLDADRQRRLRENGIRIGVLRAEWWEAAARVLNGIEGQRTAELDPLRFPPAYPVALELDNEPHDQTLFFINEDGILDGQTWEQSRNVWRLMYSLDAANVERVLLEVVPEVRLPGDGFDWVRAAAGQPEPQTAGRAFPEAGFYLPLEPGEILVVAPNSHADAYGIIGGAFLTEERQGAVFDRCLFIRPDVDYAGGND